MIDFVLDASALVELAAGATPDDGLTRRVRSGSGAAPELIEVEALQVLRRLERAAPTPSIGRAVRYVQEAPVARFPHRPLLGRIWELRHTVTAYDGAYVALAEHFRVPLLTCDAKLGRAHGHDAEIIVYARS